MLKKHADLHAAKALKALSLIRQQRHDEADALISQVSRKQHKAHVVAVLAMQVEAQGGVNLDDYTVSALTHCFKECARPWRIVRLCEAAVTAAPTEERLSLLFMAHVRAHDYKRQQQVAQQLYQKTKKKSYLFWSVMSLLMQAERDVKLADT